MSSSPPFRGFKARRETWPIACRLFLTVFTLTSCPGRPGAEPGHPLSGFDLCCGAGIEKAVHDALTGHSSSDEGDRYGLGYSLATLAKAVEKLPDQLANAKQ